MTQEDKDLLLKDLCARLPYGVICKVNYIINNETTNGEDVLATCDDKLIRIEYDTHQVCTQWLIEYSIIDDVKPYLRPMSSMTEEEKKEYYRTCDYSENDEFFYPTFKTFDWLNAHHFDYRGLIPLGLALPAKEGMYN